MNKALCSTRFYFDHILTEIFLIFRMQTTSVGPQAPQKKKATRQPRNRANKGTRAPRGSNKNSKMNMSQNASPVTFSVQESSAKTLTPQQQRYAAQQQMKMLNQHPQQFPGTNRYQVSL